MLYFIRDFSSKSYFWKTVINKYELKSKLFDGNRNTKLINFNEVVEFFFTELSEVKNGH